jgi:Fe-Mn family superoxide dismutase
MAFTLPKLPYGFDALEPVIDAKTMEIHHGKHHAGYVDKLNAALEGTGLEGKSIEDLLGNLSQVPEAKRTAVRNNGGGHYNHSLFWPCMQAPQSGREPSGDLAAAIHKAFGSLNAFQEKFADAAATRFGSGWAWLGLKADGSLAVCSTPNQDNPLMKGLAECECKPILGLDVWEHAYYLKYQNKRPDYIKAFWNVVNWDHVANNFAVAKG